MQRVAVVIPTHKEELSELEQISLAQCMKVLGHYPIIFAIPEGKNFSWIPEGREVVHLPHLGQGIEHYNILHKSPQFYEPFLEYEYILIYHVDAFVFYDALEYFCSLGYDYIGAPWPAWLRWIRRRWLKNMSRVGNSGFCLRKVKTCYELLTSHPELCKTPGNEDVIYSSFGKRSDLNFNVAPYDVACKFAMEVNPSRVIKKNGGHFPFGCHKWWGYNADLLADFFLRLGYDLRPFKNKLGNMNFANTIKEGLCEEATRRLTRRLAIIGGGYLLQYLPTKQFASVYVLKSPDAMKVFESMQGSLFADKTSFYDDLDSLIKALIAEETSQSVLSTADKVSPSAAIENYGSLRDLLNDLTAEKPPHLVIALSDEAPLFEEIKKHGLRYGDHVISFRQEYLNHCEKLFHNLGK